MIEIFLFITGLVSLIGMYSLWFYLIELIRLSCLDI